MRKFTLILFTLTFFTKLIVAQSFNPVLAQKLQQTLDSMRLANNIKGISTCVFMPGEGIWKGVSGVSFAGTPITSEMQFGIGSNTKLFTAVLLLKLYESNLFDIDDSIYHWISGYPNINPNITIRQLLNHTSGLADVNDIAGYADSIMSNPNRIFNAQMLLSWVGTPLFSAGNGWSYSNTNYLIAGIIAEKTTGISYGRLLRDSILNPLQCDSTFLDVYETVQGTIAHPWQMGIDINATPRISLNSASWSAGAMSSTASEMVQWYRELLGKKVLKESSFRLLTTFVGSGNYGFGIAQTKLAGRTVWQHSGSIRGYTSQLVFDTLTKSVIAVLVNANPAPVMPLAVQLLLALVNNSSSGLTASNNFKNAIQIVPNPSTDLFFIDSKELTSLTYSVYDYQGRLVQAGDSTLINIGECEQGIYTVYIETTNGISMHRLVKR